MASDKIKFKQLSTPLKVAIVISWTFITIWILLLLIGFLFGIAS